MRIACLHLPAFPLQVVLRSASHHPAAGTAIAVVALGPSPTVVACSRAARAAGVVVGMSATAARLAPGVSIVHADPAAERAAITAVAEALLAIAPRVDVGGTPGGAHHAIFAEVPARTRGATFGARARALLERMGLSGRVGIADDRFTARVAASWPALDGDGDGVISVPRGGSAAFLAPLPLSSLAMPHEVQHMLETLGVHTLGEFAALPPPSVARPEDADWQALARGDGGAALRAFAPAGPIVERIEVGGGGGGLGVAVGELASRIAARLAGRGQSAAALDLVVGPAVPAAGARTTEIIPDAPLAEPDELADALGAAVGADLPAIEWIEARVRVMTSDDAADGAVAAPVLAEASAPLVVAPLRLIPDVVPALPRAAHRRTRRGKERPRLERSPAAQPALFAGLDRR